MPDTRTQLSLLLAAAWLAGAAQAAPDTVIDPAALYQQHCAACHGADGKGNPAVGAPNLTDNVWLHGFGTDFVVKMINEGKANVMPAQKSKLTEDQLHVLAGYVWGLSKQAK